MELNIIMRKLLVRLTMNKLEWNAEWDLFLSKPGKKVSGGGGAQVTWT